MAVEFSRELLGMRALLRRSAELGASIQSAGFAIQSETADAERRWGDYAEAAGGDSQEAIDRAYAAGRARLYHLREAIVEMGELAGELEAELTGPAGGVMNGIIGEWEPPVDPPPPPGPPMEDET